MCKKLVFLISLVLLLGMMVANVSAEDRDWTNDSPWSVLFSDKLNWSPDDAWPGPGDEANVEEGPPHGPVLDRDIAIDKLNGPFGTQFMLIIGDANVIIDGDWEMAGDDEAATATCDMYGDAIVECKGWGGFEGGTTILNISENASLFVDNGARWGDDGTDLAIITLSDNASLELTDNFRIADHGQTEIHMSGNASLIVDGKLKAGDNDDGVFVFTMSGGTAEVSNVEIGDDGRAEITLSGGIFTCDEVKLTGRGGLLNTVDISGDALLDASDDFVMGDDDDGDTTLTMSGGTLNCDRLRVPNNDGVATIDITGGEINASGDFDLVDNGTAVINLDGGQINATGHNHHDNAYNMDITEGVMVIDGDIVTDIEEDSALGYINAYGGCGGRGDLMIDYNSTDDKTTVWADYKPLRAWNPNPVCFEEDVSATPTLSWSPGDDLMPNGRFVFLSTDWDMVNDGHILAYQGSPLLDEMPVGPLLLGRTYYWRIDQLSLATYTVGEIWEFTVEGLFVFDDFEDYSPNPNYLYDTWIDGVVDGETGSWVELALSPDPVRDDQSMWYHYDSTGFEREYTYSVATRTLAAPQDMTLSGEEALVMYFYGQPDNDPLPMYAALTDGSGGTATSVYGVLGDDPNDILVAEWTEWNIDLGDFASVDLTDVVSMSIGFGHGDPEGPASDSFGVVYFDDIQLYPERCVPKYGPFGDINDDCVVDMKDLGDQLDDWLEDNRTE